MHLSLRLCWISALPVGFPHVSGWPNKTSLSQSSVIQEAKKSIRFWPAAFWGLLLKHATSSAVSSAPSLYWQLAGWLALHLMFMPQFAILRLSFKEISRGERFRIKCWPGEIIITTSPGIVKSSSAILYNLRSRYVVFEYFVNPFIKLAWPFEEI